MPSEDLGRAEETSFEPARRASGDEHPQPSPARELNFISLLAPPEDGREPRRRRRGATALALLIGVSLPVAGVMLLAAAPDPEPPARDRSLPQLTASGPLEARDAPPWVPLPRHERAERHEVRAHKQRAPRRTKVAAGRARGAPRRGNWILAAPADQTPHQPAARAGASGGSAPSSGTKTSKAKQPAPAPAPEPPQRARLFHLFKRATNDHYYTTSTAERDRKTATGYEFIAVEGLVFLEARPGTVPLEADGAPRGHVYAEYRDGTLPVHMLRGYNGEGELYTTSEEQAAYWRNNDGWNYYGVFGYAFPPN